MSADGEWRHVESRCSCNGRRWVDDENWQPPDPAEPWTRTRHDGLIPCGFCNEGGWDVAEGTPAEPVCDGCDQPWPCDAERMRDAAIGLLIAVDNATMDAMLETEDGGELSDWWERLDDAADAARDVITPPKSRIAA